MLSRTAEPTVAERVRTVCARPSSARVVGERVAAAPCPVAHLGDDGAFVLSVPDPAVGDPIAEAPAVLELLDYPPGAPGESVRALVWVRGRLRPATEDRRLLDTVAAADPNPALLDVGHGHRLMLLRVESIVFADATGAETVDRAAVLAPGPTRCATPSRRGCTISPTTIRTFCSACGCICPARCAAAGFDCSAWTATACR